MIAPLLLVGRPKYPGRDELIAIAAGQVVGNAGKEAGEAKHKRKTFGRTVPVKNEHERPRSLIHALLDNDPNDDAADGVSVGIVPALHPKCPICDGVGQHKWNCTLNK